MSEFSKTRALVQPDDTSTSRAMPSQSPASWDKVFAALDDAGIPDRFLADRAQGEQLRDSLFDESATPTL
jgi:hypothetical protein